MNETHYLFFSLIKFFNYYFISNDLNIRFFLAELRIMKEFNVFLISKELTYYSVRYPSRLIFNLELYVQCALRLSFFEGSEGLRVFLENAIIC